MPALAFAEMTLRAPGVEPPIMAFAVPPLRNTPQAPFPRAIDPLASVPMRLPWSTNSDALPCAWIPVPRLAEMTLPAPGASPPTTLLAELMVTPMPFPRGSAPVTSVPMKFPWILWPDPNSVSTPSWPLPEMRLRSAGAVPPMML